MLKEKFDLTDKKALVTGAGGGIGAAQAKALAEFGADVALADLKPELCRETAEAVEAFGVAAHCLGLDVTDKQSVTEAVARATEAMGRIDILCNTAGINFRVPLLDYPEEQFEKVMDVNLKGMFLVSQAVAPQMIERGWGKIINMSSIMGQVTYFGQAAYCSSKGGVDQLTKVMGLGVGQIRSPGQRHRPDLHQHPSGGQGSEGRTGAGSSSLKNGPRSAGWAGSRN